MPEKKCSAGDEAQKYWVIAGREILKSETLLDLIFIHR